MTKELSAGGIIIKKDNSKTLILLVKHQNNTYVFPKGHVKKNETIEQAALREVEEETGFGGISIIKKLGTVTRNSVKENGSLVTKDIVLYLMNVKDLTPLKRADETDETFAWLTLEEALKQLRYKEDVAFLIKHKDVIFGLD